MKEKLLTQPSNLPAIYIAMYKCSTANVNFGGGREYHAISLSFAIEGQDGKPVTNDDIRHAGVLMFDREQELQMILDALGKGIVTFMGTKKDTMFVSGDFADSDVPGGWRKV